MKRSVDSGVIEKRTLTSKQHIILVNGAIFTPECDTNEVYDRETKRCTQKNVMQIDGIYLDVPWKEEFGNTSSKAFKEMAQEKAYQLYGLMQMSGDGDNILGVKVVGARKGSVVLNVQIVYRSTVDASQAFEIVKSAIQNPPTARASRIVEILNIRREKIIEVVEISPKAAQGDVDKMTLIVLIVVLAAVVFIAGVVALKFRSMRRAPAATATFTPAQVKGVVNPTLETVS